MVSKVTKSCCCCFHYVKFELKNKIMPNEVCGLSLDSSELGF